MDVKAKYKVTGDKKSLIKLVRPRVMQQLTELVNQTIDAYLEDLQSHMGTIEGSSAYAQKNLRWAPLDEETLEESPKFWYESGKAKKAIIVNMKFDSNGFQAFVGIPESSEAFQEVVWNELGFTPENGDKLVRRPLFLPLADIHKKELQSKIRSTIARTPIRVKI
jgi:hypothetical protein